MNLHLSKKSIIKKTTQIGSLTLVSRLLGIVREILMVRYFGVGAALDAFIAAFKLPNFFRHIFAEGAMSASFVPAIVKTVKEGNKEEANGLMSISFLFFEGLVLLLYAFVLFKTEWLIYIVAPGFSPEQVAYTIDFLRILFSVLLFISSSALLAGALNAVNHFFIPAFATPLWNMIWVITLIVCLSFKLPTVYLCAGIILGAFVQFMAHLLMFFRYNFSFGPIDAAAKAAFKSVLKRFLPGLFGVGIVEFNLFVSGSIASYLPKGSVSLLYLGSRFMNIPLGMFAVALSSVMLSHFSRLVLYAPRRLNFYLLEVLKFITWIITPAMLFLMFVSRELFVDMLGAKATPELIEQGGRILILYASGLLFLCFNKILLSMLYALKDTTSTAFASGTCALINIAGDLVGVYFWGAYGIGLANTISALAMTTIALFFLYQRHKVHLYARLFFIFFTRYLLQLALVWMLFWGLHTMAMSYLAHLLPMMVRLNYWLITGLLAAGCMWLLFATRKLFKIELYFLKK